MLRLHPIEFLLRAIPEGFLFIFAIYVFSKVEIDKKKYIISSIMYALIIFIVRLLPINYGVHTILALIFLVLFITMYNQIDAIKVMRSVLIIFLIQFLTEGINMVLIDLIPNINTDILFNDPIAKTLLGLPSLIAAYLIVYLFYLLGRKKEE